MWDWLDEIINLGADAGDVGGDAVGTLLTDVGDFGGDSTEWFVDSATGELVTAEQAAQLADLDLSGSGSGPLGGDFTGSLDTTPSSGSTSDMLRSLQADPSAPGRESFDWAKMADPSASIASAGNTDWMKALAQGLKSGMGLLGAGSGAGGLAGLANGGGGAMPSMPGLMGAGDSRVSAPLGMDMARVGAAGGADVPAGGSGGGLGGLGMQGGISALLSHLQADPGTRLGLQAPVDAGPTPRPFTPLVIPTAGPVGGPMAQASSPRISGLQKLLMERFG